VFATQHQVQAKIKTNASNILRIFFLYSNGITINVPLILTMREIIFFVGQITLWAISRDILRGPRLF
jgi:hypothetical protein